MKKLTTIFRKNKKKTIIIGAIIISVSVFILTRSSNNAETTTQFVVVATAERGSVSSGIETTGTIIAANKLNLDVYKQSKRIEVVNVVNGGYVEAGDVLFSFDKSSANVATQSAQTKVTEAKLALQQEQENYNDENTQIKSLDQQINDLQISIEQAKQDKIDAYKKYLNANLEAEPGTEGEEGKIRPTISGYYNATDPGEYQIEVYNSSSESGMSFRAKGLSSETGTINLNNPTSIGTSGLKIMFPSDVKKGDQWIVAIPNTYSPYYAQNLIDYEESIIDLDSKIAGHKNNIEIYTQNLGDASYTDSSDYRNLALAKAQAELSEARVTLSENYEVVQDQDIIAPFSGTIDGLENVVVGATPSGSSEDPISFGTLISDDFLVNFSLGAVDVAKVTLNQKVLVTVTSFTGSEALEAYITEISSLPESDGVAQYEVQAFISVSADMSFALREGLLADIEIVEDEVLDVVRIPRSAISYVNRQATVSVLDVVSGEQQNQIDRIGILRVTEGIELPTYPLEVSVGLEGSYYVEITNGLEEGQYVITSESSEEKSIIAGIGRTGGGPPPVR